MLDTGRVPLTGQSLTWFRQGLDCVAAGDFDKAVAHFNQVIRVRSDYWEAWYERGLALEEVGCFAEAIRSYEQALTYEPSQDARVEIWLHRGNAFQYGLGDYDSALACYDRVIQQRPTYASAWHHRGNALLYGAKKPEVALTSYQAAIDLDPNNAVTWRNRGNAWVELKDFAQAIESYDFALELHPDDPLTRQARTLAVQQCGLTVRPPTTKPVWYGAGYTEETLVDGEETTFEEYLVPPALEVPLLQPRLVVEDEQGEWEIALTQDYYTIGRDLKNEICLRSQYASRFHAVLHRIERPGGQTGYQITDGGLEGKPSTNGILVNGRRISGAHLQNGDAIIFGPKTRAIYRS